MPTLEFVTAKQKLFVAEYARNGGQGAAAARAAGYAEKSASVEASRLLRDSDIQAEIVAILAKGKPFRAKAAEKIQVNVDRVLSEFAKLSFDEKPLDDFGYGHKLRSLELLGRHLGMFEEQNAASGGLKIEINVIRREKPVEFFRLPAIEEVGGYKNGR